MYMAVHATELCELGRHVEPGTAHESSDTSRNQVKACMLHWASIGTQSLHAKTLTLLLCCKGILAEGACWKHTLMG